MGLLWKYPHTRSFNKKTLTKIRYIKIKKLKFIISRNVSVLFKNQFRHLIFYSIPDPILLVLRKRLNFIFLILCFFFTIIYTIL